jgi:hypothetical protein
VKIKPGQQDCLSAQVNRWPTLRHSDWKGAVTATDLTRRRVESGEANLPEAVVEAQRWPTPKSRDYRSASGREARDSPDLNVMVKLNSLGLYPTPVSSDTGSRKHTYSQGGMALSDSAGGQLNPTWVEWLMGFPLGWTDCGDSATRSSRKSPSGSGGD